MAYRCGEGPSGLRSSASNASSVVERVLVETSAAKSSAGRPRRCQVSRRNKRCSGGRVYAFPSSFNRGEPSRLCSAAPDSRSWATSRHAASTFSATSASLATRPLWLACPAASEDARGRIASRRRLVGRGSRRAPDPFPCADSHDYARSSVRAKQRRPGALAPGRLFAGRRS
jgi:hypothetical protein